MPAPPRSPGHPSLGDWLQDITTSLTAVGTQDDVLRTVLNPAVQVLGAVVGAALLVDVGGTRLELACCHGAPAPRWAGSPLDAATPPTEALRRQEALYLEKSGASAVIPMVLGGQPVGVLTLDFQGERGFSRPERHFLNVLGAQAALALGRIRLLEQLHTQAQERAAMLEAQARQLQAQTQRVADQLRAQEAYAAYAEAAGTETDLRRLARQAGTLLCQRFADCTGGYYELEDDLWKLRVYTDDLEGFPDALETLRAGVPRDSKVFADALATREAVFVDGSDRSRAVAVYPLLHGGEVRAVYGLALGTQVQWQEPDRALFRAVGRSLRLALERAEVAGHLQAQRDQVRSHNRALEAFAQLSRDLALDSDAGTLIRRTLEILMTLLPPGYAAYWVIREGCWHADVQVNDVGNPELQAAIDAGLPAGQTPTLDIPAHTREPYFQSTYRRGTDTAPDVVSHIHAVGCVPVIVNGQVTGIVNVPLFEARVWSAVNQVILTTAMRSLGLALERAGSLGELARRTQELEASNAALQLSNTELEAFSYSVSHDLRAPLRHVKGFVNLVRTALGRQDLDKAQRHLDVVDEAATRMNTLIDAMLEHSRIVRGDLARRPVPLDSLLEQARRDVEPELVGRQVEWRLASLPVVPGDPELLQEVMTNLLANAVKFTRYRDPAVIEVWADASEQGWTVSVKDNGAGFDPAYAHKLFGVFQRLHHAKDFAGTGVGLATVRRILLRHGGDITAQSEEGQGATFQFTLPGA